VTLATFGSSGYKIGLFLHILAVVLAFGPTFAYGILLSVLGTSPRSAPALLEGISRTNRYMVTPGTVIVLLAGVYLLAEGDWDSGEAFIAVGFVAIFALLALQLFFFMPQGRRARELAARDLERGDSLSDEFEAVGRRLGQVGSLAGLIVVVTIFFMTYKPFL
jgi:uncharacterized membrane protein